MPRRSRSATTADAAAIAEIYNWYIAHTVITFEVDPVSADGWWPLRNCASARR